MSLIIFFTKKFFNKKYYYSCLYNAFTDWTELLICRQQLQD